MHDTEEEMRREKKEGNCYNPQNQAEAAGSQNVKYEKDTLCIVLRTETNIWRRACRNLVMRAMI